MVIDFNCYLMVLLSGNWMEGKCYYMSVDKSKLSVGWVSLVMVEEFNYFNFSISIINGMEG